MLWKESDYEEILLVKVLGKNFTTQAYYTGNACVVVAKKDDRPRGRKY